MKLNAYLDEAVQIILDNEERILQQAYFLQCLMQLKADNAPKNLHVRLVWDVYYSPIFNAMSERIKHERNENKIDESHIDTLLNAAFKKSNIMSKLNELTEETKTLLMEDAKDSAQRANKRKADMEREKREREDLEHEKAEREANDIIKKRNEARLLYRGYGADMTDKQFDKFHEQLNSKARFDGKIITEREWIEIMLFEHQGFPVVNPKGENKKPFDTYALHYFKVNHNGNMTEYCPTLNKALFMYAAYLHGNKVYSVTNNKSGESKEYTALNPYEAMRMYFIEIGVDYTKTTAYTSTEGICRGTWNDSATYTAKYEREAV